MRRFVLSSLLSLTLGLGLTTTALAGMAPSAQGEQTAIALGAPINTQTTDIDLTAARIALGGPAIATQELNSATASSLTNSVVVLPSFNEAQAVGAIMPDAAAPTGTLVVDPALIVRMAAVGTTYRKQEVQATSAHHCRPQTQKVAIHILGHPLRR